MGRVERLLLDCPWLLDVLRAVRAVDPELWVGAGAVRDVLWDTWYGHGFDPAKVKDVDVVFFDSGDLDGSAEAAVAAALARRLPGVVWDVKNQAAVHLWYERRFGCHVEPLTSIADAVSTWPEFATCVAVRLTGDDRLDVLAPLGLDDLLAGVWRRNPRRVSVEEYRRRLAAKRVPERWPRVRVAA
jgi:hypothetical protein